MLPRGRIHLSTLLVAINVALLLLAVSGVAFGALHLLGQLADEQAFTRVRAASTTAVAEIARSEDDLFIQAQVLAQRPTLNRLLAGGDLRELQAYLDQYQQTSHLPACAIWSDGHLVTASGAPLIWSALPNTGATSASRFLTMQPGGLLVLGAWAPVTDHPQDLIITAQPLDAAFTSLMSQQIELPASIRGRDAITRNASPDEVRLWARALASDVAVTVRLRRPDAYVTAAPLRAPSGETVGVIETQLPAAGIETSWRELAQTLLLLTLIVTGLTVAVSFLLGRRLGSPLLRLASAAERMGSGDLATPVPTSRSQEIGMLATTLDEMRTQLLHATQQLRHQRAEAHAILTGIVEGVFTVDRERRIQYLNPQAAAMLDIAPEAAVGRFCGDVLKPARTHGIRPCDGRCPIVHARFQGTAKASEHLCLSNGTRRTVVISSAAPNDEQQVQVLRDETEVEATRRLRDAVLANISHEFKTPLAAQLASIELLLDRLSELSVDEIGDLVVSLQRGSLRLTQLIDNLLESVRIESGRDDIRHQRLALDEIVEESIAMTRPLLDQRGQYLDIMLPYPLPAPTGDVARMTQVFVNLLANASKFAPAGTTVCVGGEVGEEEVTLWVDDEGPGIPAGSEQTLFERFMRATGGEPEQSGMGLGLWIAQSIVERHGGRILLQRRERGGTRVAVTLLLERIHEDSGRR